MDPTIYDFPPSVGPKANYNILDLITADDLEVLAEQLETEIHELNDESDCFETPTPLYLAASLGRFDICRLLISFGAQTDVPVAGDYPLHAAFRSGNGATAGLLWHHTQPSLRFTPSTYDGIPPIACAALRGDPRLVRLALEDCRRLHAQDGISALLCAREGYLEAPAGHLAVARALGGVSSHAEVRETVRGGGEFADAVRSSVSWVFRSKTWEWILSSVFITGLVLPPILLSITNVTWAKYISIYSFIVALPALLFILWMPPSPPSAHTPLPAPPARALRVCPGCLRQSPHHLRAHHCASCRSCSVRFDHHCQFLRRCIDGYNLRFFVVTLAAAAAASAPAGIACSSYILYALFNKRVDHDFWLFVVALVGHGSVLSTVAPLLGSTCDNLRHDVTQYEVDIEAERVPEVPRGGLWDGFRGYYQ